MKRGGQTGRKRSKLATHVQSSDSKTGQTGQRSRTNESKRAAKPAKPPTSDADSLSAGEAARQLGISARTVRRLCSDGQLRSFRTPGGQVRVSRGDIESFPQGLPTTPASQPSGVLENRRESLQTLNLELQERRLRRELRRFDEQDDEKERERSAAVEAENLRNQASIEQARTDRNRLADQRIREQEQLEAEQERQQWIDSWVEHALKNLPRGVPNDFAIFVQQSVEEALATLTPTRPQGIIQHAVTSAVNLALAPWKRQHEIGEAVKLAKEELPFAVRNFSDWFPPTEWELRALSQARAAISRLSPDVSLAEIQSVAQQVGRSVAREYETGQTAIRIQQERASNKSFLVSIGTAEVEPYLRKLHLNDDIFDEDLERKSELEQTVRSALEARLTGAEPFTEAQRIAREMIDADLNA